MSKQDAGNPVIDAVESLADGEVASLTTPAPAPALPYAKPGHGRNQFTWTKDRPGPGAGKKGNSNALKSGLRSKKVLREALRLGKLPAKYAKQEKQLASLRSQIESAVIDTYGEINLTRAALVETVLTNEIRRWLAWLWLWEAHEKLDPESRLRFMAEMAVASTARDKALERLALGRKVNISSAWDRLEHVQRDNVGPPVVTSRPVVMVDAIVVDAKSIEGTDP